MTITIKTDRFGGMVSVWKPKKPIGSEADIIRRVRRVGPYGDDWELVKAVSKLVVFRRGREISKVTYTIET